MKKIKVERTKPEKIAEGKKFTVNCGWTCEVIKYIGCREVKVRWDNDGSEQIVRADTLRSGELKPTNCEIDRSRGELIQEASKEFLGKQFKVSCGWTCVVKSYNGKREIEVVWKEDGSEQTTNSTSLRKLTTVPNNYRLYGVGLHDMREVPHNKEYLHRWRLMLMRCYFEGYQEDNPTYRGVTVCEEWLTFSCFHKWCESWGDIKGLCLDKDNKGLQEYSPESCVFLTPKMNSAMVADLEKGFRYRKGKYEVSCNGKYIGVFESEEEAKESYKAAKAFGIKNLLEEYRGEKFYDSRAEVAIINWCYKNLGVNLGKQKC